MKRLTEDTARMVDEALSVYGAKLDDCEIMSRLGKLTGVYVTETNHRLQFRNLDGILYSGQKSSATVHVFVSKFWYWKTLEQILINTRY